MYSILNVVLTIAIIVLVLVWLLFHGSHKLPLGTELRFAGTMAVLVLAKVFLWKKGLP